MRRIFYLLIPLFICVCCMNYDSNILMTASNISAHSKTNQDIFLVEDTTLLLKEEKILATAIKCQRIKQGIFSIPTLTTGFLRPVQFTTLHLRSTGMVEVLNVQEGELLQKGAIVAQTDSRSLELEKQRYQIELNEALFKKNNLLILHGGDAAIDTSVSSEKLDMILTQSGVKAALQAIQEVDYQISLTKLIAPFKGYAVNLDITQYQQGIVGQEICHLFNPNMFEVEFQLTEREALRIKKGQRLSVIPLARQEDSYTARVNVINPVVNSQGLVTIRARLKNIGSKQLFKGMNVRIQLERRLPDQLAIPKEAVVLRSGRQVVFTYNQKEGVAKWNYVNVGYENEKFVTIAEGLKEGDWVIHEGHMNLNHDAKVRVEEENTD